MAENLNPENSLPDFEHKDGDPCHFEGDAHGNHSFDGHWYHDVCMPD